MPFSAPEEANVSYVQQHNLHVRIGELLDEVMGTKPSDPMVMMATRMAQLYLRRSSVEEELATVRVHNALLQQQLLYFRRGANGEDLGEEIQTLREENKRLKSMLGTNGIHVCAACAPRLCDVCKSQQVLSSPSSRSTPYKPGMLHPVLSWEIPEIEIQSSRAPPRSTRFGSFTNRPSIMPMRSKAFTIIHFNDVYNITPGKSNVGAPRFKTLLEDFSTPISKPLILFSGDCFGPSVLGTILKGEHMVPVLNHLGVQCSVVGNHDLDFGVGRFKELSSMCTFPFLLSNVIDRRTKLPLEGSKEYHILHHDGVCIGLMGLVESEYISTVSGLAEVAEYVDMISSANQICAILRQLGVQVIIALTHMRTSNDNVLAKGVPCIDMILGGHDHETLHMVTQEKHIIKSGSDFNSLSVVQVTVPGLRMMEGFHEAVGVEVQVNTYDMEDHVPPDSAMETIVNNIAQKATSLLHNVVGSTAIELDVRTGVVRRKECPIGNWVTTVTLQSLAYTSCDVVLLQGGCLRHGSVLPIGPLTAKDLLDICPIEDIIVVIEVSPADLWDALEGGVARYPALEGRFPHIAGGSYVMDCHRPRGSRIKEVKIKGKPINRNDDKRCLRLGTSLYLANGNDGYDVFGKCKRVIDSEQGQALPGILRSALASASTLNARIEGRIIIEHEPMTEEEYHKLLMSNMNEK